VARLLGRRLRGDRLTAGRRPDAFRDPGTDLSRGRPESRPDVRGDQVGTKTFLLVLVPIGYGTYIGKNDLNVVYSPRAATTRYKS
jgi:hypothetical protein